jgi:DNA (cytosine-5)-methyltransferase 1
VCSGIEAASVAWEVLGFSPAWFSQFDPEHKYKNGPDFPSAVLAHHWPEVPNLGDMTKLAAKMRAGEMDAPDILVGGTPCQAFSVAGARAGLSDPRGQLTISYGELADAIDDRRAAAGIPPAIIVWENVPGVLSSKDNAFGAFLGLLAGEDCELQPPGKRWENAGYVRGPKRTIAWRILDAQYFGVAQRRRRVFVVASARTDIDPTKILFESDGVRRDIAPSRSAGKAASPLTSNCIGVRSADDNRGQAGHLIAMAHGQGGAEIKTDDSAPTLTCNHEAPIVASCFTDTRGDTRGSGIQLTGDMANTLHCAKGISEQQIVSIVFSSNGHASFAPGVSALRAKSGADHETLAVAFQPGNCTRAAGAAPSEEVFPTLKSDHGRGMSDQFPHIAYGIRTANTSSNGWGVQENITHTLDTAQGIAVSHQMAVRRLTPVECERLQGFPDNHTLIPTEKRKQITAEEYAYLRHHFPNMTAEEAHRLAADGPRYKAIGNSMAVPVMRWIGNRILSAIHAASVAITATE